MNGMVEHATGPDHHFVAPESNTIGTLSRIATAAFASALRCAEEMNRLKQQIRNCPDMDLVFYDGWCAQYAWLSQQRKQHEDRYYLTIEAIDRLAPLAE